jgi:ethanolamine utilization protein EutQ (cupin superfamily)
MRTRWVIPPREEGWPEFALSEWELTAAGWSDRHPHSETNVVLEGELHVESDGVTVVARVGDTVTVPAGAVGRYWAPVHARMIAIYGPNADAEDTDLLGYWEL